MITKRDNEYFHTPITLGEISQYSKPFISISDICITEIDKVIKQFIVTVLVP